MTFPHNKNQNHIGSSIAFLCLGALLSTGAWFALTSTLDDMTRADCEAGIVKACEQLKK